MNKCFSCLACLLFAIFTICLGLYVMFVSIMLTFACVAAWIRHTSFEGSASVWSVFGGILFFLFGLGIFILGIRMARLAFPRHKQQ
jgi:hypothetical protein